MALSQKFPGLMIVPWFNSHEWKYVKSCILGDENMKAEALSILKIWKKRSPNLPSAVEGTLIILDSLLEHSKLESSSQRFSCYCNALLRFSNILCGQSAKQGTFYSTAKNIGLPDVIIDYRHILAHGQALPGESEIHYLLSICLDWVIEKYWQKQSETLRDYIKEDFGNATIICNLYCNINVASFLNVNATTIQELEQSNSELREDILNFEEMGLGELYGNIIDVKNGLLKSLGPILDTTKEEKVAQEIVKIVIKVLCLELMDINDLEDVPIQLQDLWRGIIHFLYSRKFLLRLIWELLNLAKTYELLNENKSRPASLWLKYIFGMCNEKTLTYLSMKDIPPSEPLFEIVHELDNLVLAACSNPNRFTNIYLLSLLELGQYKKTYIQDTIDNVEQELQNNDQNKKELQPASEICQDTIMFDTDALITSPFEEEPQNEEVSEPDNVIEQASTPTFVPIVKPRYKLVTDTKMFENCPLGVLPTQTRKYNPLINFSYQYS